MKLKYAAIPLLAILVFTSSACSVLKQDAQEIKVIPKSSTVENVSLNENNTTEQTETSKPQNSQLDDKRQSLQANTESYIKDTIESRAMEALSLLKDKNMEKLAELVHPDKGVRFSAYGHVFTDTDLIFSADQVKALTSDNQIYKWGVYDGSGEPIELTFNDYYKKFVYDEDFINTKQIGYNKIIGKGNIINNNLEVYPNSIIVEFHFPGFDPKYDGMDWRSLRLVFEKKDTTWYLTGIIHDQWTI